MSALSIELPDFIWSRIEGIGWDLKDIDDRPCSEFVLNNKCSLLKVFESEVNEGRNMKRNVGWVWNGNFPPEIHFFSCDSYGMAG